MDLIIKAVSYLAVPDIFHVLASTWGIGISNINLIPASFSVLALFTIGVRVAQSPKPVKSGSWRSWWLTAEISIGALALLQVMRLVDLYGLPLNFSLKVPVDLILLFTQAVLFLVILVLLLKLCNISSLSKRIHFSLAFFYGTIAFFSLWLVSQSGIAGDTFAVAAEALLFISFGYVAVILNSELLSVPTARL